MWTRGRVFVGAVILASAGLFLGISDSLSLKAAEEEPRTGVNPAASDGCRSPAALDKLPAPAQESAQSDRDGAVPEQAERSRSRAELLELDEIHRAAAAESLEWDRPHDEPSSISLSFGVPVSPSVIDEISVNARLDLVTSGFPGASSGTYHSVNFTSESYELDSPAKLQGHYAEYVANMIFELRSDPDALESDVGQKRLLADFESAPSGMPVTGAIARAQRGRAYDLALLGDVTVGAVHADCPPLPVIPPIEAIDAWSKPVPTVAPSDHRPPPRPDRSTGGAP